MTATKTRRTLRLRVLDALVGNGPLTAEEVHAIVSKDGRAELRHVAGYLGDEGHRRRVWPRVDGDVITYTLMSGTATSLRWGTLR